MGSVQAIEQEVVLPGKNKKHSINAFTVRYEGGHCSFMNQLGHQVPCVLTKRNTNQTCIYFHGNDENIDQCQFVIQEISSSINASVICLEYPGFSTYNLSKEQQKQMDPYQTILMNCDNFIEIDRQKRPGQSYIVIGRSLGSCPAIYFASKHQIKALVLISPIYSMTDIFSHHAGKMIQGIFKNSFRSDKIFRNEEFAKNIICPVLIIHGKADRVVPFEQGLKLRDQFTQNQKHMKNKIVSMIACNQKGHNDIGVEEQVFFIKDFVKTFNLFVIPEERNERKEKIVI